MKKYQKILIICLIAITLGIVLGVSVHFIKLDKEPVENSNTETKPDLKVIVVDVDSSLQKVVNDLELFDETTNLNGKLTLHYCIKKDEDIYAIEKIWVDENNDIVQTSYWTKFFYDDESDYLSIKNDTSYKEENETKRIYDDDTKAVMTYTGKTEHQNYDYKINYDNFPKTDRICN